MKGNELLTRQKLPLLIFVIWAFLALGVVAQVTGLLKGSFPIFTVVWILIPLIAVLLAKDADRVGFRPIPWRDLACTTAINLATLLVLMLIFEPWSHTYQHLIGLALAGQSPDTTFAWLLIFPKIPALGAIFLFSGLVTLFGEELFFRGWLLQLLKRRWGAVWTVILQAFLFTIPNLPVAFVLPALQGFLYILVYTFLGIGLIGGWAASRTNSIWPSLLSATLCNLILVALIK